MRLKNLFPAFFLTIAALLHGDPAAPPTASTQTNASLSTGADPFLPPNGVFPGKGRISSWKGFLTHNRERRKLFAKEQAQDHDGLVFVGDSITDGWNTLRKDFADLGVKIVNRGIGGDTTPNLLYRLQDDVLSLQPRGLVILIGTNDLGEQTSPEDIVDNFRILHARIRAAYPTIPIAWCLVMPRTGDNDYPRRIHELNTQIAKFAASDPKITVCDTFTPFAMPDGTSIAADFKPDHLHPNATGYEVWRRVLDPVLRSWNLSGK